MVLKKTNYCAVNSGNTMKKRSYRQNHPNSAKRNTHVIKMLYNIATHRWTGRLSEVDDVKEYIDDGNLKHSMFGPFQEIYSLNKKKRWLLKEELASCVWHRGLSNEPFKITMVHRLVPCHGVNSALSRCRNVTQYYDSHAALPVVEPKKRYSTRHDLARKAVQKESPHEKSLATKRNPYHNQHFRNLQRKPAKRRKRSRERPHDVFTETFPEIRYEIAEPEPVNSHTLQCLKPHGYDYNRWASGTRFRGYHRQKLEWYLPETVLPLKLCKRGRRRHVTESFVDGEAVRCDNVSEEDTESEFLPPPRQQSYSLCDLIRASQRRHQQRLTKTSPDTHTPPCDKHPVNPATTQTVKKHGKGSAIFIEQEHKATITTPPPQTTEEDAKFRDITTPSELDFDDGGSLGNGASVLANFEKELERFDESFTCCGVPENEVKVFCLRDGYGSAVAFAWCAPVVARFDLQAVWQLRGKDWGGGGVGEGEGGDLKDWWLLCQLGDTPMGGDSRSETKVVRVRLVGDHEEGVVSSANEDLRGAVTCRHLQLLVLLTLDDLLCRACDVVRQGASHRQSQSAGGSNPAVSNSRKSSGVVARLSYNSYAGPVEVCGVQQAFGLLQAARPPTSQSTRLEDLVMVSNMNWGGIRCSICFTVFDDDDPSHDAFSVFLVMTMCGHSFCRQCWQRHLVSGIMEGKTTLRCMEYKCETTVDPIVLMSLVPHAVYSRWQQRLQSQTVESSGEWTWCPNARCGRLARNPHAKMGRRKGKDQRGLPVACQCQRQWCLHCAQVAHWPITCPQFASYTKMLRQNGEEDGIKSTFLEITSVRVKRCPNCRYPIEKSGGCSHMQCSQCSNSFCWVCLALWSTHISGDWRGCQDKPEETIELENNREYPLPIECYKKAVSYRYMWKQLVRKQRQVIATFYSYCAVWKLKGGRDSEAVYDQVPNHVVDAYLFLKKGHSLLELCFILLSNAPRRHRLTKPLHEALHLLDFLCQRVHQFVCQRVRQVVRRSSALVTLTQCGDQQLQRVSLLAHGLASSAHSSSMQQWLLHADHEHFVKFR